MSHPDFEPTLRGFSPGQRLFGRYVLERIVGRGGMGVVWKARDETLGETIALKVLPEALRWDAAASDDLKEETRRARQLSHPNIIRIYDFIADDSAAAISMELVEGKTLAELRLAKPNRVFDPSDIIGWLPQVCDALDYAHTQARIVHRDLKPANLMLTSAGVPKIADFGVARSLLDATTRLSQQAGGTISYMSPQQAMGADASPSDDIYALGATLYELLAGKLPFYSGDIRAQLMERSPEKLSLRRAALGINSPLPEPWEEAIKACLLKKVRDRPASGAELLAMLARPVAPPGFAFGKSRSRLAGVVAAALGFVAAAIWFVGRSVDGSRAMSSEPQRAVHALSSVKSAPAPFVEFADDFISGFAGWLSWGEPRPQRISSFQGRRWVLDNNGDDMDLSGLTSLAQFSVPKGFVLESDVFMNVTDPAGCHCEAYVALTRDPANWANAFGSAGDTGDGLDINFNFAGDACWGTPAEWRRHMWLGAGFIGEDGQRVLMSDEVPREQLLADRFENRWVNLRAEVSADREIRFFVDGKLVWAPTRKLHPSILQGQRIVLKGRSMGSAGKAYHDWVRLRALGTGGTRHDSNAPMTPLGEALLWRSSEWEPVDGQPQLSDLLHGADANGVLSLAPWAGTNEVALHSRSVLAESLAVYFTVQPLLQSHGGRGDLTWLGIVSTGADGKERFVGVELTGGDAWLIDTARGGDSQRVHRLGGYSSGNWQAYSLHIERLNEFVAVGSFMVASSYNIGPPPPSGWKIAVIVRDSGDGIALRPVRATLKPR